MVYNIKHDDIYDWNKQNREHFDLSEFLKDHLKENTKEKVLGKFKDETRFLPIVDLISYNPKCYRFSHVTEDEMKQNRYKKTLKGYIKWLLKLS